MADTALIRYKVSLGGATLVLESPVKPTMKTEDDEVRGMMRLVCPGRVVAVQADSKSDPHTIMHAQRLATACKVHGVTWITPEAGD